MDPSFLYLLRYSGSGIGQILAPTIILETETLHVLLQSGASPHTVAVRAVKIEREEDAALSYQHTTG